MITNLVQVPEGFVTITLKSGQKVRTELRFNDREHGFFWLEPREGDFEALPYAEVEGVSVPLKKHVPLKAC
jgi:hypothetical protein